MYSVAICFIDGGNLRPQKKNIDLGHKFILKR
jgi:hypothetical protein